MNKILAILLTLVVQVAFAQAVWDGSADTTWYTKNKSAKEFTITTAKQLAGLAKLVNGGAGNGTYDMQGKTINLGADIMLNDTTNWIYWKNSPPTKNWLPIGSESKRFKGTFDGKGHKGTWDGEGNKILGAYINSKSDFQGLFGFVGSGGTIKNLIVSASYVEGGKHVGGLIGSLDGEEISFSLFSGIVKGINFVGGFAGSNGGKIVGSYSDGAVVGNEFIGGFAGFNYYTDNTIGQINHCFSISTVVGIGSSVGGFIGENDGTIGNSYSTGRVTGDSIVGGFTGENNGTIGNSYSYGTVIGKQVVGGLVGYNNGGITSSYSIGLVPKKGNAVGGLVGANKGTINSSYYDRQTSTQSDGGKGIGKTTAQMKQKATFAGWDFEKIWNIKSEANDGYPYLLDL